MPSSKSNKWALIILGSIIWSLTMVKSGLVYDFGMGFWGPNGHDGIWHLSLINSLARGSLALPIMAGESIQNYHLGFDLLLAGIHAITRIPAVTLYFQIIPPLLALSIGYFSFDLVNRWTKSTASAWWATFFVYFGGSLGWLVSIFQGKGLGGESMFWSHQSVSTLINPPFALSLLLLLLGLLHLTRQKYLVAAIIFAILPHVKIYAGLLAFGGLLCASVKNRRLLSTLGLSLLLYLPTNFQLLTTSSHLLVWQPGWFLETMMGLPDRLNWPRFYSAMINYRAEGFWVKAIPAYGIAFALFWIGNMGTRLTKEFLFFSWLRNFKTVSWLEVFSGSVIVAGGLIPMFFLQRGTSWNTIQFLYYSLFFSSLLAGLAMGRLLKINYLNNYLKIGICALVILFTIPTTLDTLKHYLPARPPAMISNMELQALNFLRQLPPGTVLTPPVNVDPYAPAPRPLYLYESTAYVSAFSVHPVYLEDQVNLDITGYDWPARRAALEDFFINPDIVSARQFLADNHIKYIYLPEVAITRPALDAAALGLTKLFDNSQTAIWGKP